MLLFFEFYLDFHHIQYNLYPYIYATTIDQSYLKSFFKKSSNYIIININIIITLSSSLSSDSPYTSE